MMSWTVLMTTHSPWILRPILIALSYRVNNSCNNLCVIMSLDPPPPHQNPGKKAEYCPDLQMRQLKLTALGETSRIHITKPGGVNAKASSSKSNLYLFPTSRDSYGIIIRRNILENIQTWNFFNSSSYNQPTKCFPPILFPLIQNRLSTLFSIIHVFFFIVSLSSSIRNTIS